MFRGERARTGAEGSAAFWKGDVLIAFESRFEKTVVLHRSDSIVFC